MFQHSDQHGDSIKIDGDDEILYVPKVMMNYPLGFVVDAGASTTKVIYRSKKDYSAGEAVKSPSEPERGKLRLRNFDMNEVGDVIDFLRENCDMIVKDEEEWWMTGITTQHFKKQLESAFNIRTKLFSELLAMKNFLKYFDQMELDFYETDLEALTWAKDISTTILSLPQPSKEMGGLTEKDKDKMEKPENLGFQTTLSEGPSMKLLTMDVGTWVKEYFQISGKLEYPFLFVILGSTAHISLVKENGDLEVVDFIYGIGKVLSGLAEELTGESSFDKFIEMAERGDLEKVDMTNNDVRHEDHEEDDWYKLMPRHFTIFELGKLSSANMKGKGNYTKDDLAIGLLSVILKFVSKMVFVNAKLCKAKSILLGGSLLKYKLVRHHLARPLLVEAILNNFKGLDLIKIHFVNHPGFAFALGVWWENVEKQQDKNFQEKHGGKLLKN